MKLLHIDSSILGAASASRRLSAAIVAQWRSKHPEGEIVERDLAADPIPHLGEEVLSMRGLNPGEPTPEIRHALAISAAVLDEYLSAVFGFFGITDIRFVRAEGVNISPENREQSIAAAERDIPHLLAA